MTSWREILLMALGVCCAAGQIYPPVGGYPDGGSVGVPVPGSRTKKTSTTKSQAILHSYQGVVESLKDAKLVLAPGDGRKLDFTCTKDTKYDREGKSTTAAAVKVGALVTIEARQNAEGYLFAVTIHVDKDAPAPAAPEAAKPADKAAPAAAAAEEPAVSGTTKAPVAVASDPDDPGPPKLKYGKPERVKRAEQVAEQSGVEEPPAAKSAAAPPPPPPPAPAEEDVDDRIAKAREMSETFTETLPNYIVQQFATRYFSDSSSSKTDWRALDILSTEVIYDHGKETYRNVRINNKLTKKPLEEVGGSVSSGEFGSTLMDLFSQSTNAKFRRRGSSTCSGRAAWLYDFSVEQPSSHWTTRYASHMLRPAYRGSVWLDQADMRTLRIEMQARDIPEEYPLDAVEWVVEYGLVRLGTTREYLVPVHAENMACWRGTSKCARNSTDFRNYRRFTGEAEIYTTDSTVDFGAEAPKSPTSPKKP